MRTRTRQLVPVLVFALAVGLLLLMGYRSAAKPFGQTEPEDGSQAVQGRSTVGQTFVAPFDGLSRVHLFLGTGGHPNNQDVLLHLRAGPDASEDLRSATVNGSQAQVDGWVEFEFAPVPDSGGKRYYLLLESPTSAPGNAVYAFRSLQDRYRDGVRYQDGAPAGGDLAFQIQAKPNLLSWLGGVSRLLAQGKPSVFGSPAFYGIVAAGCLIGLGAALGFLAQGEPEEGNP